MTNGLLQAQDEAPKKTLEDMEQEVYEVNLANGWFEDARTFGDDIALLHSEISEMFEAFRDHRYDDRTGEKCRTTVDGVHTHDGPCKPEGVGSEAADALIRLLDTCRRRNINLRFEYERKIAHNRTRGYKHGGRTI